MTKFSPLFIILLLVFLSIGVVAQSNTTTTTDGTTTSDQSNTQVDGTTSTSGTTDGTTPDPSSTTPAPATSSTTPNPPPSSTTQEPSSSTTTQDPYSTTTTVETTPQDTTTQSPQTTPITTTPAPVSTTNSIAQTTSSVIVSQTSSLPASTSIFSISSSLIASASTSSILPLPSTVTTCSASNATCPTGQYCNAANQTCLAVLADGSACSSADMCSSGICSNSICTQSSSSGQNSTGKIVGIVLGSLGGIGFAAGALFCVRRRNQKQRIRRMRGFTPSMALNGHLNDKNMGTFKRLNNADRHNSDYSFTSEQAALESLSSMSMSMSPIGRQSAVYYKDNQLHSLSGTISPFDDGDTTSFSSSQPVMMAAVPMATVPMATYKNGVRSSKFDFLQNAFANRKMPNTKPASSPMKRAWTPTQPPSVASSVRDSGLSSVNGANWQALVSQPPSRSGFVDSERRGSNRMSTTTFGSGHHHVGIGDDESVADPNFSPIASQTSANVVISNSQQQASSHNPFRNYTPSNIPQDAWTKEDEDGMGNYQYF